MSPVHVQILGRLRSKPQILALPVCARPHTFLAYLSLHYYQFQSWQIIAALFAWANFASLVNFVIALLSPIISRLHNELECPMAVLYRTRPFGSSNFTHYYSFSEKFCTTFSSARMGQNFSGDLYVRV
jgi:hypothetical protein